MTTAAFDGLVLASDRMVSWESGRTEADKLLLVYGGAWFAAGGTTNDVLRAWEYLRKKPNPANRPDCKSLDGVLLKPDNTLWNIGACLIPERCHDPFHAIGSGAAYAMAAMHLGQNAIQAIEVAAQYSHTTGLGIDAVKAGDKVCKLVRRLVIQSVVLSDSTPSPIAQGKMCLPTLDTAIASPESLSGPPYPVPRRRPKPTW